jgi:hypothetical protein
MMSLTQSTTELIFRKSNRIGHGDKDHAILEQGHSIKR